mmetsp:Transcript_28761/g.72818  ORF Transcript_28761/g.72818 Transcript_28761/m.72818 type:complete len:276 (+) Transcript_28761:104-931(+)
MSRQAGHLGSLANRLWLARDVDKPRGTGNGLESLSVVFYVGVTTLTLLGLWRYEHNLHGRFWLGDLPVVTLLVFLMALLAAFAIFVAVVVVGRTRGDRKRERGAFLIRCTCTLMILLALATAVLGHITVRVGDDISHSLAENCGDTGTSKAIQQVHHELETFHSECQQQHVGKVADECPGFVDRFPAPAPYARYLKVLEQESGCAGFCHHAKRRLFFNSSQHTVRRPGCAAYLGAKVDSIARSIGVPCVALGLIYALLGVLLLRYGKPEQTPRHA